MSTVVHTIDEAAFRGVPRWYTFKNYDGVSHLYVNRYPSEPNGFRTLCGLSNEPGEESQTANHCKSCTARLKAFVDKALVEHEWLVETVTVVVVRPRSSTGPAPEDAARELVARAVEKRKSWNLRHLESETVPFIEAEPEVDTRTDVDD